MQTPNGGGVWSAEIQAMAKELTYGKLDFQSLQGENVTLEELIRCLEIVRQSGNVVVVKLDGERSENQYQPRCSSSGLQLRNELLFTLL